MSYLLYTHPDLDGDFAAIPEATRKRLRNQILALADNPRPPGAIKIKNTGKKIVYRVRVGDYRIGYEIHDRVLTIVALAVARRDRVYPLLKRRMGK